MGKLKKLTSIVRRMKPDKDIRAEKLRIGNIPVLVLHPKMTQGKTPALLWLHGGGYFLGMKEMVYMGRAADLVKKFGITVFSPGYRRLIPLSETGNRFMRRRWNMSGS